MIPARAQQPTASDIRSFQSVAGELPAEAIAYQPVRVMHLIACLNVGGAEMMLANLLSRMDREQFHNIVYSMMEPGPIADTIRRNNVEVRTLGMMRGVPDPRAILQLARGIRRWQPDVIQTWMYHADLLGGIAGKLLGNIPVVWGIHSTDVWSAGGGIIPTRQVARICARLSSVLPTRIVCCAEASRRVHAEIGYQQSRMLVIHNGFDLEKYRPASDAKIRCERQFGIPATAEVISLIARYHPIKDHATFFAAARIYSSDFPNTRFVLCGDGIDSTNQELMSLVRSAGIAEKVILLGRRKPEDIALIMSRSAFTTSSSRGEAFSNVIGEAMACGRMCVVTDVGDSAHMVGDCGIVVQPDSPRDLAAGWAKVASMNEADRVAVGLAARRRVMENFTVESVVARYQNLYLEVAGGPAAAAHRPGD